MSLQPRKGPAKVTFPGSLGARKKKKVSVLCLVDIQNDFINGSLAVPNGAEILPVVNKLRMKKFDHVYLCHDYHPTNHCSFRSNNPGSQCLYQMLYLPSTGDAQVMWPDHCVQGSLGAQLHDDLLIESTDIQTFAGCNPKRDSYSIFKDNGSRELTEMVESLTANNVDEIYIAGLALEYVVLYTALDAKRFLGKSEIYVIEDGCRGITEVGVARALKSFQYEKISVINSEGPEIGLLENRRIDIKGGYVQSPKSPTRTTLRYGDVDSIYESIIFDDCDGTILNSVVIERLVNEELINRPCSWSQRTLLHACCEKGNIEILRLLLSSRPNKSAKTGLNLYAVSTLGETALHLAVQCRYKPARVTLVRMLLNAVDPAEMKDFIVAQTTDFGMSSLMFACRNADQEVVEELLSFDSSLDHLQLRTRFQKTALMFAAMKCNPESAVIFESLLRSQRNVSTRLLLIGLKDSEDWTSIHFSAKNNLFANIDWFRILEGDEDMCKLPINEVTSDGHGFTPLQLAAFNGRHDVIRTLVEEDGLRQVLKVNVSVGSASGDLELDLAVKRNHLECARLLLRLGCHASTSRHMMQELLHRLVLMGDVVACESILDHPDENDISIDEALVVLTQRLEHPETCTFDFADFLHEIHQFMYKCEYCNVEVCLVCKDKCHGENKCRKNLTPNELEHCPETGWTALGGKVSHCNCERNTCCARSITDDARERGAVTFLPAPLDTSHVFLDGPLTKLMKHLARNTHNLWCASKVESGWRFGKTRIDDKKLHPLLKPYDTLTEEENKANIDISAELIKVIVALGYVLNNENVEPSAPDPLSSKASINFAISRGRKGSLLSWSPSVVGCAPIKTDRVCLTEEQEGLVKQLAKNTHEVWALDKVQAGYRYSPARSIKPGLMLSEALVPYKELSHSEQEVLEDQVRENIKAVISLGWKILPAGSSPTPARASLGKGFADITQALIKKKNTAHMINALPQLTFHNLPQTRKRLFNNYLFASARRGDITSINILLSKRGDNQQRQNVLQIGADLNACDSLSHSAIYIAIKRGHIETAKRLLRLNVKVETKDSNGLSPLGLCAYLGNEVLVKELVQHNADILSTDAMGFTPLHHAANQGNLGVCKYLTDRLQQEQQNNEIVNLNAFAIEFHTPTKADNSQGRQVVATTRQLSVSSPQNDPTTPSPQMKGKALFRKMAKAVAFGKLAFKSETPEDGVDGNSYAFRNSSKIAPLSLPKFLSSTKPRSFSESSGGLTEYSPLSLAVNADRLDIVKMLINSGANPMLLDGTVYSPSSPQALSGASRTKVSIAPYKRALLRHIELQDMVEIIRDEISQRALQDGFNTFSSIASKSSSSIQNKIKKLRVKKMRMRNQRAHVVDLTRLLTESKLGGTAAHESGDDPVLDIASRWRKKRHNSRQSLISLFSSNDGAENNSDGPVQQRYSRVRRGSHTKSLTTRDLNKLLDIVMEKFETATAMVDILNTSPPVRRWRKWQAVWQFLNETTLLILMLVLFSAFVQTAPDYNNINEFTWTQQLHRHFTASIDVHPPEDVLAWVHTDLISKQLRRGGENGTSLTLLKYNYVFGGVSVRAHTHFAMKLDRADMRASDLTATANVTTITLSPTVLNALKTVDFEQSPLGDIVRSSASELVKVDIQFNVYNKFHDLFGIVELTSTKSFFAEDTLSVEIKQYALERGRFPPSRSFQYAMAGCILVFTYSKLRSYLVGRKIRAYTQTQWLATFLLALILAVDIYLYETTKGLKERVLSDINHTDEYMDMTSVHRLLRLERVFFGFFFFLSMTPLLLATRTIPNIGPVVVALLNTMVDTAVVFYLGVVATSCFLLTLTFHVSFGAEVEGYGTLTSTFYNMFHTPFIETWQHTQDTSRMAYAGVFLSSFYILFSTITLNLLIAIVSSIYPNNRLQSDSMWEKIITQGIENKLRDDKVRLPGGTSELLRIQYWKREELLLGRDGLKHWSPNSSDSVPEKGESAASTASGGTVTNTPVSNSKIEHRVNQIEKKLDVLLATLQTPSRARLSESEGSKDGEDSNSAGQSEPSKPEGVISQVETKLEKVVALQAVNEQAVIEEADDDEDDDYDERSLATKLLHELVLSQTEPCPLQKVKEKCKLYEPQIPWAVMKSVRRELGIVQCKETILTEGMIERVVRFWRKGTQRELEKIAAAKK